MPASIVPASNWKSRHLVFILHGFHNDWRHHGKNKKPRMSQLGLKSRNQSINDMTAKSKKNEIRDWHGAFLQEVRNKISRADHKLIHLAAASDGGVDDDIGAWVILPLSYRGQHEENKHPSAPQRVNKHFFDLVTQTHMSSSAAAAATDGSQLRLFCNLFVGSSFINTGQKWLKKRWFFLFHSPSRTHTGRSISQRKQGKFCFSCYNSWQPEENNTNLFPPNFRTIRKRQEGNCFYSKHQTDCKYFSRVFTQKHNSITSHRTLQFPMGHLTKEN